MPQGSENLGGSCAKRACEIPWTNIIQMTNRLGRSCHLEQPWRLCTLCENPIVSAFRYNVKILRTAVQVLSKLTLNIGYKRILVPGTSLSVAFCCVILIINRVPRRPCPYSLLSCFHRRRHLEPGHPTPKNAQQQNRASLRVSAFVASGRTLICNYCSKLYG